MNAPLRTLQSCELLPGDVLLSLGDSEISTGIVDLDGGTYSHAALWSGTHVVESTLPVVREAPLDVCREHARLIDVYRHVRDDLPRRDIVSRAREHLGKRYGALDLGIATLTVAVSSWMPGDWAEMNSLYGSDRLARALQFLSSFGDSAPTDELTCAELVATVFLEVETPLTIQLEGGRAFKPKTFTRALLGLAAKLANRESTSHSANGGEHARTQALANDVLESFSEPLLSADGSRTDALSTDVSAFTSSFVSTDLDRGEWEPLRRDWMDRTERGPTAELAAAEIRAKRLVAGVTWSANLVTPRLLERSSDLRCLGRIWQAEPKASAAGH